MSTAHVLNINVVARFMAVRPVQPDHGDPNTTMGIQDTALKRSPLRDGLKFATATMIRPPRGVLERPHPGLEAGQGLYRAYIG